MLIFIFPTLIVTFLLWAGWFLYGVWRLIPDSNADFELAGLTPGRTIVRNPAGAFYAGSGVGPWVGGALRLVDAVAPALGTRSALRLFGTPLPWKLAARTALPERWERSTWSFEAADLASYRLRGLEPGRPVVLLVHGWAGSGAQMAALGDALAATGFDPVLLDFPAHGRSGGFRSTLPQFSRALFAAVSRIGPLHAVVAHSLGAVAALHASARGLPATRLVLIAPSAPPAVFLRWFASAFGLAESIAGRMERQIEAREAVAIAEFEPDWLGGRVGLPTLVVHDEADRVAPHAVAEHLVAILPRARLHSTQGLGHRKLLADRDVAHAVAGHLRDR